MTNRFDTDPIQLNPAEPLLDSEKNGYAIAYNFLQKTAGRVYQVANPDSKVSEDVFLRVQKDVFIPTRVANTLLEHISVPRDGTVLDVGCGSGVLGLGLCKKGGGKLVSIDPNPEALKLSEENSQYNEIENAEFFLPEDFFEKESQFCGEIDCIVANLPQVPENFGCGENGNQHFLNWVERGKTLLSKNGIMYLPIVSFSAPSQSLSEIRKHYDVENVKEFFFPVPEYLNIERAREMAYDNLCTLYSTTDQKNFSVVPPENYDKETALYSQAILYKLRRKKD
jgi:methylase of polypeptide subunit release factors